MLCGDGVRIVVKYGDGVGWKMGLIFNTVSLFITLVSLNQPGTLTFRAERQCARMSKITNDGLTRSAM